MSVAELAIARQQHPWAEAYARRKGRQRLADLAYSNGTFHHIPPAKRMDALGFIFQRLKPGGIFALWENNPWNPGTRWVIESRIPFDRDAINFVAAGNAAAVARCGV